MNLTETSFVRHNTTRRIPVSALNVGDYFYRDCQSNLYVVIDSSPAEVTNCFSLRSNALIRLANYEEVRPVKKVEFITYE